MLRLTYTHNHPITSAHALSFRDVAEETKQAFYNLFEIGHSASSARHAHQQALYIQADTEADAQKKLADHAQNPLIQDICRLFTKWREANYGKDDGKDLFEKLQEKVDHFNATESAAGGKAFLQWYEAPEKEDIDDPETQPPPAKKHKKELRVANHLFWQSAPHSWPGHTAKYARLEKCSSAILPLQWTGSIHLCSCSPQLTHAPVSLWLW